MTTQETKSVIPEIIEDSQVLARQIDGIRKAGAKLDRDIHQAACSCLFHAETHGDHTLCTRLVDSMPRSSRRKALVVWFESHGRLAYGRKDSKFRSTKRGEYDLEGAKGTPFWSFTEEREPGRVTYESIVSYLEKLAEGKAGRKEVDEEAQGLAGMLVDVIDRYQREADRKAA